MEAHESVQEIPQPGLGLPLQLKVLEYLVTLANSPGTSVVALEAVIGWDPLLTRSVILKANASFGLAVHSRDLNLSLALLGSGMVKETVKLSLACTAARRMINSLYEEGILEDHGVSYALVTRALAVEVHCSSSQQWWDENDEATVRSGLYSGVMREELVGVFEQLSEEERFLLTLHYYEGLSLKIVAGMLGLPEEAAEIMHDRALQRLREAAKTIGT